MSYPLVNAVVSQHFKDNPTAGIRPGSPDYWIIEQFGNYQPNGHTGLDFSCAIGTKFYAVAPGRVLHVGYLSGTYADNPWWIAPGFAGFVYVVDHYPADGSPSFIGIYGHGKDNGNVVKKGDWVEEGQQLGLTGNTGGSTGPHLHFEVMPDGFDLNNGMYGRVDPTPYLENTGPLRPQEDELSAAEVNEIKAHINAVLLGNFDWEGQTNRPGLNKVLIENQKRIDDVQKQIKALPTAIWWGSTVKRLDENGKEILIPVVQELANIRSEQLGQGEILVEISEQTSAETLANLVADAQVEDVIAELRARLAPKEGAE